MKRKITKIIIVLSLVGMVAFSLVLKSDNKLFIYSPKVEKEIETEAEASFRKAKEKVDNETKYFNDEMERLEKIILNSPEGSVKQHNTIDEYNILMDSMNVYYNTNRFKHLPK
jgi:beta-lactam-binding protein with PASTA domain